MADVSKPPVSSDVPATVFGLAAAATAFFPPQELWEKLAVVGVFVALSLLFLYLKLKESKAQDASVAQLQRSIDDLVTDLRHRERELLSFQQRGTPRPVIVLEYDCDFENTPELPFSILNVGNLPALNVTFSPIQSDDREATLEEVPSLQPGAHLERLPDLAHQGLMFRNRLRDLLDSAWHQTRWLAAAGRPKEEIRRIFAEPVVFPITVTYSGPTGDQYEGEFELVYLYFGARAYVRLRTATPATA